MRITSITLAGFRGFTKAESIDLDADAVIVSGANGRGKTSLFDGILWALTGSVERLHGQASDIISLYSPTGEARVELNLEDSGSRIKVVRRLDGQGQSHLSLETADNSTVRGASAETALIELLWPEARAASEPNEALSRSLTRAMYLQQDVVREFVEADDEQTRFNVVSELVGVGRVTELQRQLEIGRTAWSRATNRLNDALAPVHNQISTFEERLRRLGEGGNTPFDSDGFDTWVQQVQLLVNDDLGAFSKPDARSIEQLIAALQSAQRSNEREIASIQRLMAHLDTEVPESTPIEPLRAKILESEALVDAASTQVQTAQESLAAERRRQTDLRDQEESLRALAHLALRHLGERCPVCDQPYDEEATRARLERQVTDPAGPEPLLPPMRSEIATAQLEAAQRQLAADEAALRDAERDQTLRSSWEQVRDSLAGDAQVPVSPNMRSDAERLLRELQKLTSRHGSLRDLGEQYSLQFARSAEHAQRAEIEGQLLALREDLTSRERERDARALTGELANTLLAGLRNASTRIVTEELERIGPLLQRIYARVEPHPSFRAVRFLTTISRGHGRVWTTVVDESEEMVVNEPSVVLSSSQLNVLAVSTFLSLNLAIETLPLQVVAIDDPLQSLDTVNLLGLADLLRRIRTSRQVLVSTHDDRLADLLSRKLRPIAGSERTRVIRFEAWNRDGPIVDQFDVPIDAAPLKLVAAS